MTILTGPEGVGKTTLMREIAKTHDVETPHFMQGDPIPPLPPNPILTFGEYGSHQKLQHLIARCFLAKPKSTIYFEYPDAGIGWEAQKSLIPLLSHYFPKRQFVLETQSPILISRLYTDQVLCLQRHHERGLYRYENKEKPTHWRTSSFYEIVDELRFMIGRTMPEKLHNAYDYFRFYGKQDPKRLSEEEEAQLQEAIHVITVDFKEVLPHRRMTSEDFK
jgi:hypothetical protein